MGLNFTGKGTDSHNQRQVRRFAPRDDKTPVIARRFNGPTWQSVSPVFRPPSPAVSFSILHSPFSISLHENQKARQGVAALPCLHPRGGLRSIYRISFSQRRSRFFCSSTRRSAIMAMNSELVGLPLVLETV